MTRHLLGVHDLSAHDFARVLDLAESPPAETLLLRKGVALVFEHPSARTRNACEMAVVQLGGHPVTIRGEEVGFDKRESVEDVAHTLACYHALLAARVARHGTLERMAAAVDAAGRAVPVVNLLSDREHPTQAVADLLTIREKLGSLKGKKVVFLGDGACNVCNSWLFGGTKTGMELWITAPKQFQPAAALVRRAGGGIHLTEDVREAAKNADVLYTDVWVSMGKETEAAKRLNILAPYQLNAAVLKFAKPDALVMHCLPAYVSKEIAADVFEAHQQTIFDQAENRLHAQKAILTMLARAWRK